MEQLGLVYTKA